MALGALRGGIVLSMTVHTLTHAHGPLLGDLAHLTDVAMAVGAAHTRLDVGSMIELHMVGQGIDALPIDRPLIRGGEAHLVDLGIAGADHLVAVHALLNAGHARIRCNAGVAMAHGARDAVVHHVHTMLESNGLFGGGLTLVPQDAWRHDGDVEDEQEQRTGRRTNEGQITHLVAVAGIEGLQECRSLGEGTDQGKAGEAERRGKDEVEDQPGATRANSYVVR